MNTPDNFNLNTDDHKPLVVCESESPVCNMQAFVEKSDSTYYFYLFEPIKKTMKVCWICNRKPAPLTFDPDSMKNGNAPMMTADSICHAAGGIDLDDKNLSIVWFEQGTSAALLCGDELICVIPEWSGYKDFHGYSKYAVGTGRYAWEMKNAADSLMLRVEKGRKLWHNFGTIAASRKYMMSQLPEVLKFLSVHGNDFDISKNRFPTKAVVSGSRNNTCYCLTIGASLAAMPNIEMYVGEKYTDYQRTEFGFAAGSKFRQLLQPMAGVLGNYTEYPWNEYTFFAHGHTIPFSKLKGFEAVLFVNPDMTDGIEKPVYPRFQDGTKVNLLWIVPLTKAEYDFAVEHDAETMLSRAKNINTLHIFDGSPKFNI
ncbi:MAG: suppressor of fused domain protein [Ruminococcus sp.]|nr:suppressor of fused domain protein [Ruminococcus sp.]